MRVIARKDWASPPARARVSSQTIQDEIASIRQLGFRFSVWSSTSVSLRLLCLVVAPSLSVRCSSRAHFFDALLRSCCSLGNKQQCGPCDSFLGCTANFLANFNPRAPYPSFVFTSHTSTCPSSFMACVDSPLCHVGRTPSSNLCLQFSQTCLRFVSPPILQTVLSLLTCFLFSHLPYHSTFSFHGSHYIHSSSSLFRLLLF